MPSASVIKASNANITEATAPGVAVFIGATAGIAKATVTLLTSKNTPMKAYILGRNGDRHKSYLDQLRASNPKATIVWLEGQVSLLSEVQRLCDEIKKHEKSIDLLFLSAGYLPFSGRVETSEGLETSNVLNFWGRALFTELLLPLLRAESRPNPTFAPRVISILAAGDETDGIPLDDLDLKQPKNFSITKVPSHYATLNTLFFSKAASRPENRDVVFIHNHPGVVPTGITHKNWGERWWGPLIVGALEPLINYFIGTSIESSAERSLYLITGAEYGGIGVKLQEGAQNGFTDTKSKSGGLFCVSKDMECIQPNEGVVDRLRAKDGYDIVWEETQKVIKPYI